MGRRGASGRLRFVHGAAWSDLHGEPIISNQRDVVLHEG